MLRYFINFVLAFLIGFSSFSQASEKVEWVNHKVSDLNDHVKRAKTIFTNVRNNSTFQDLLSGVDINLPAKILPSDKDERYALYLDSLNFTKDYAYATIYMVLDIGFDKEGEKLIFVGKDIRFSRKGGFTGNATLQLAQSVDVNFGEDATVTFLAEELYPTYVKFDCNGFKEISLSANIAFESSFAYPVDEYNRRIDGQKLETKFNTVIGKWEDWVAQVEISKFQLTKLPDFTFDFGVIAYDHSDLRNPSMLKSFPDNFNIDQYYGGNEALWRGLYVERAGITMPRMFHKKESPRDDMSINGYDLFIDKTGFSGLIEVDNLLRSDEGNMSSWEYSVDHLMVDFSHGTLISAGLDGGVTLPVSSGGDEYALGYSATIAYDETKDETIYDFTASTESKIDFNIFNVADVELKKGSELNVLVVNKKFKPSATLSGNFKLAPDLGKASEFTLEFEKMLLETESPYVSFAQGGGAALSRENNDKDKDKVAGFPIEITELGLRTDEEDDERLGLDVALKLNFMGTDGTGMTGDLGLTVWGKRNNTVLRYEYDDIDISKIGIEYSATSFYIKGYAEFFKGHELYGDGFKAELGAKIADKIKLDAKGFLGTTETDYRYWMVELEAEFPSPIPFFPGAGINTIMGGAYYHMSFDDVTEHNYIPDETVSLGLKAGIGMQSIPSDKAFGGKVQLELNFDEEFRFRFLQFQGELQFVRLDVPEVSSDDIKAVASDVSKSDESGASAIVEWDIRYNVPLKTLSGIVDTYIQVPASKNPVIAGKYSDYNAGTVSIFFSDKDWYVWVGKPAKPLGFNFKIGSFKIGEVSSYFVMGTQLPSPPMAAVPKEVGKAISNTFDPTMLKAGAGVGLGFRFNIGIEASSPRILGVSGYFNATLGAGFDVLFMKSKYLGSCTEKTEFGVNNWYGYGQVFVYASASVGADINVGIGFLRIKEKVDLLSVSLATYMYFQGPNPSYAKGSIQAEATALGFINCEFDFDVEFGDNGCGSGQGKSELEIYNYSMPSTNTENVDPYITPTVYLSVPIAKEFRTPNADGEMIDVRVALDVKNGEHNYLRCTSCEPAVNIDVEMSISKQGNLVLKPLDVLPSNETFLIHSTAFVQRNTGSSWAYYDVIPHKVFEAEFKTRAEGMLIPSSNIAYSYPLPEMKGFYKDESNLGYISTLVKPHLPLQQMVGYVYQAQFYDGSTLVSSSNNVTINNTRNVEQIKFPIPSSELEAGKSYIFKIVQTKEDKSTGEEGGDGKTQFGTTNDLSESEDSVIVQYTFTTSVHNTFADKMASMAQSEVTTGEGGEIIHQFTSGVGTTEAFSDEELEGYSANNSDFTKPFIQVRYKAFERLQTVANNTIYKNHPAPAYRYKDLMYENAFKAYSLEDNQGLTVNLEVMNALQLDYNMAKNFPGYQIPEITPFLPKGSYGYFLDYYLPGKKQANSSVSMQYTLNKDVAVRK